MDIYWPLRSGNVRDVRSGEVIAVEALSPAVIVELWWYLVELHREFAGEPEELDTALTMIKAAAALPDGERQGSRIVGGQSVSFQQALEAARETVRVFEASLDRASGEDWAGSDQ
jgi:hypothetical protein